MYIIYHLISSKHTHYSHPSLFIHFCLPLAACPFSSMCLTQLGFRKSDRNYLLQIKRLLEPGQPSLDGREPGICLFDLLMGIEVLQAPLLDLLLDVLLQLCHQQPKARPAPTRTRRQPMFSSLASAYSRSVPLLCICYCAVGI